MPTFATLEKGPLLCTTPHLLYVRELDGHLAVLATAMAHRENLKSWKWGSVRLPSTVACVVVGPKGRIAVWNLSILRECPGEPASYSQQVGARESNAD